MLGHGFLDFLQREQGLQDLVRQIGLGLALCADLERRATIDEASLVHLQQEGLCVVPSKLVDDCLEIQWNDSFLLLSGPAAAL